MKGNPVINAGSEVEEHLAKVRKMKTAFERENALRNKIVKAMAAATGISEKHFINDNSYDLSKRISEWTKSFKRKVKKDLPELEDRIAELEGIVEEKEREGEEWRKRAVRIRNAAERMCSASEQSVRGIRAIEHDNWGEDEDDDDYDDEEDCD